MSPPDASRPPCVTRAEGERIAATNSEDILLAASDTAKLSGWLDLAGLLAHGAGEPEWAIEPIVPAGRVTAIAASAKTGKSLLLLDAATAAATGRPFLGCRADPRRVLYLDFEMCPEDIAERLEAMGFTEDDGPALTAGLAYLQNPMMRPLDTEGGAVDLLTAVDAVDPDVVIIDTLSRVIAGKENDSDTFTALARLTLAPLKARGIAVVLADHVGHEHKDRARGSSAKTDVVDLAWSATATDDGLRLKRTAQRIGWAADSLSIRRHDEAPLHRIVPGGWPAGTAECAQLLDELEIDPDHGDRRARQAINDLGRTAPRNEILRAAIKFRRARIEAS